MPPVRFARTAFIGILISLLLALGLVPIAAQESAEELYSRGLGHLQAKDFEKAAQAINDALALQSNLDGARLNLGIAYFQLGKYDEALQTLNEALGENPDSGTLHFFAALTHQGRKDHEQSIHHFEEAARLDSEYNQLSAYNIGLAHFHTGKRELSARALNQAIQYDPKTDIAREAEKMLQAVEAQKEKKRLSASASVGIEYDDNVTVDELDQTTNLDDFATVFEFSGAYKLLAGEKYEVEAGYDFFQSLYDDLSAFDLQSHLFSLTGSREIKGVDLGLNTIYNRTILDDDKLLEIYSASPSVGFFMLPTVYSTLNYAYRTINFFDDDDRDSQNHSVGINNYLFFMGSKGFVNAGYTFENEITTGREFGFFGHFVTAGVQSPIPGTDWDTRVILGYKYFFKDYKEVTASIGEERADYRHTLQFGIEQPLFKFFKAKLDYQYINSTSNLASSDFDENIVNFSISAYY